MAEGETVKLGADVAGGALTGAAAGSVVPGIGTAIGGVVGAGLGLLGGIMGSSSARDIAGQQVSMNREYAQNAIQWRVADAQKAGIHPLYALGAPTFSPASIMYQDPLPRAVAESGQDIGRAIEAGMSVKDQMVQALQLDLLKSQVRRARAEAGQAEEQELNMYTQRQNQNQSGLGLHNELEQVNPSGQVPQVRGLEAPGAALEGFGEAGWYSRKAGERISPSVRMSSVEAGVLPGYSEVMLYPGFPMMVPQLQGESWAETWNEMSIVEKNALLRVNGQVYGSGWYKDAIDWFVFGSTPSGKYGRISETGGHPSVRPGARGRELLKELTK